MRAQAHGFSLVEVMVAAVVLAIGMLGLSLLVAQSVRFSHVSAMHSQATLLAQSMIDRMASNVQGVWLGLYDGTFAGNAGLTDACTVMPCAPAELAARDVLQWRSELAQLLPADTNAVIACTPFSTVDPTRLTTNPTYDGVCRLNLSWQELDTAGAQAPLSVSWKFRP